MTHTAFVSRETLEQLDWHWVVAQLRSHMQSVAAREGCDQEIWLPDRESAHLAMREAGEARQLLDQGHPFPLGSLPDIRPLQERLEKEAVLQPLELLEMASWLDTVDAVRRHLVVHRNQVPLLHRYAATAPSLSHLVYEIRGAVDETGEVRDEASPELASLRKKARKIHREIHEKLEDYLTAREYQDLLQDRYYTIKEDRYVLPIKTNQKSFVDGIVLGSSSSGATLFIEPRQIVDLNNSHKLALLDIQKECYRVLQEICEDLRQEAPEIRKGLRFLTLIDLVGARARFARSLRATLPSLDAEAGVRLLRARHPLLYLSKQTVVANDIVISLPTRALLVTGPNAGGKTAVLKTVGILALMARAGIPLPVAEGSNMPFFETVFSDIGDSQSLQEDRSTFSGHISRLSGFLGAGSSFGLALLDEILIGTDPQEGSVLAQAVLEHLLSLGGFSLVSTHFLALKAMAARDPRIQNASLGFHPVTLAPTYEMTTGVPGTSNAFFIARQLRLPEAVLERARELLGESKSDIQDLLLEIHATRNQAEQEKAKWEGLHREAEKLRAELQNRMSEVAGRERELKRKYRERLEAAFQESLRELQELKRRRKSYAGTPPPQPSSPLRELGALKQRLLAGEGPLAEAPVPAEPGVRLDWSAVHPGDRIYLPELKAEARVLRLPDDKGLLSVEAGGFRVEVHSSQVSPTAVQRRTIGGPSREGRTAPAGPRGTTATGLPQLSPAETVERCDLRGLTVEEALQETARELDRASRSGQVLLVIIHGLGKGALRDAVRAFLASAPYPISYRAGRGGEGGDGVTVVTFQ